MFHGRITVLFAAAVITAAASTAHGHDHWLMVSDFTPAAGSELTIDIMSGHHFPESSFAIGDNLIGSEEMILPGGAGRAFKTSVEGKKRTGKVLAEAEGPCLIYVSIKRPQMKDPIYEMKGIIIAGGRSDDASMYSTGKGLEIVPASPVSSLAEGSVLPLYLMLDGDTLSADIEAVSKHGVTDLMQTSPGKPAMLTIPGPEIYMVQAAIKGRGCSLVFRAGVKGTDEKE